MAKSKKFNLDGGSSLGENPFAALSGEGLPEAPPDTAKPAEVSKPEKKPGKRHRLDIKRVKSGRGGKVVTVISGFPSRDPNQLNPLAKKLKNACATGGAVKGGTIEIQGDQREKVSELLEKEGFRPVLAGG